MSRSINYVGILMLTLTVLLGLQSCGSDSPTNPEDDPGDSNLVLDFDQFLVEADQASAGDRQSLVDSFLTVIDQAEDNSYPLVQDSAVVWLYKNAWTDSIPYVFLMCDYYDWDRAYGLMDRVNGTSLYYLKEILPKAARVDYRFKLGEDEYLDPWNPLTVGNYSGDKSVLRMPEYQIPIEVFETVFLPVGNTEPRYFQSEILNNDRDVIVYTPPGYLNSGNHFPVLYLNDGKDYMEFGKLTNVLDYNINNGLCKPLIVVMINPLGQNRATELAYNDNYTRMLAEELVPFIADRYNTIDSKDARCIMGAELGGLCALYTAYNFPGIFGNAAGQSSLVQRDGNQLGSIIQNGPKIDINIYMDVGLFEKETLPANRELRDVLANKGYQYTYNEYPEGKSWGNWRAHVDEVLQFFVPMETE